MMRKKKKKKDQGRKNKTLISQILERLLNNIENRSVLDIIHLVPKWQGPTNGIASSLQFIVIISCFLAAGGVGR